MNRQRRFTFQEALRQMQKVFDDVDNDSDAENTSASESESISDDVELPVPPEELSDIDVYEEESEDDFSDEDQDPIDDNASLDDDQVGITAGNATYYENRFPRRLRRRNILTQQPRIIAAPEHEVDAFKVFYRPEITLQIVRETNRKARDVRHECALPPNYVYKDFTSEEVEAGLAIMIRAGLDRDNFTDLRRLWDPIDSRPFYRVTMALNRFKFLLRCMRFDNYRSRPARQRTDRLAAIREVWEMFNNNLRNIYVPNEALTVDEQLVGYRGKIPGRTYMPSKPRKYGVKFFWLCEATTGFALNGMIYSGRESDSAPHTNLANDIVMKLCLVYFGTGRDIYVDRYFTSHGLVCNLLEKNLTLVGTIMANRREVPSQFKTGRGREVESTKALYDHANKILLLSYVPKRNKNVLMMSSSHSFISITDCHSKPTVITDYNKHKGGVNTLDENCEEFNCLRMTNRWPMVINYNLINVATNNAFIVMRSSGKCGKKTNFLKQLSFQLAQPYVSKRKLKGETKLLAEKMGFITACGSTTSDTAQRIKRGRCYRCAKHTRLACIVCRRRVCPQHRKTPKNTYCMEC